MILVKLSGINPFEVFCMVGDKKQPPFLSECLAILALFFEKMVFSTMGPLSKVKLLLSVSSFLGSIFTVIFGDPYACTILS